MNLQGRDLNLDLRGGDVALLHRELATIGLTVPDAERRETLFGQGTHEAVAHFQKQHCMEPTGVVDAETARAINVAANPMTFTVQGKVVSRLRAGVGGLRVEIVDKNVGNDVQLADAASDDEGGYCATFNVMDLRQRGKRRPDLQARVFAGETFLGASKVCYNASNRETLNVLLTEQAASALPSEHETLIGALSARFRGNLRDLKETDDRQDITYLANKTGWDARAVALAALADQFSARTMDTRGGAGIEQDFFYALFRAGLPANENALYQTDAKTAAAIWKKAIEQGVIPAQLENRISQAAEHFQRLAVERALNGPALAGVSPLKEMLSVSLGDDPARQKQFAELYTQHRGEPEQLWEAVRGAFGEEAEKRLRIDGQLGYLTLNNAPLMRKLHDAAGRAGLTDTMSLAQNGYYSADKWQPLIGDSAIPPEIPGENTEEKRARYAEVLAAQVRLSFPTMVVAQMVRSGETPLKPEARDQVHAFLTEHQGKFEIGMQPVQQYIARNQLQVTSEVSKEITRMQRVYQITPSDGAMNALLRRGLDSALAVSRYDRDLFIRTYKDELGGEANARLTHAKAQQVHNAVLNIATSYLVARTAPQIGVHSLPKYVGTTPGPIAMARDGVAAKQATNVLGWLSHIFAGQSAANAADVIPYATLEGLFGKIDYCACEHCRSVLSPAAYLVDLLQFLDREGETWTDFLAKWKTEHSNATYPFDSEDVWIDAGTPAPKTPLDVLLERRPDIEHLPLTCENTNTPLPYIDLVNETLEYYIVSEPAKPPKPAKPSMSLENYEGHSTDSGITPEELLANPQFVKDTAYDPILKEALFPPPLPFHQALENLRRYFDKFEAPLPEVMEALRKNDDLERANDDEYGWRDILMEELRLSRAEYDLLTNSGLTIQQLYGYEPGDPLIDVLYGNTNQPGLSNAKVFTRRLGISYEEIVDILKTRFVNPNLTVIPKLERLGVTFAKLQELKNSPLTGQTWLDQLPEPLPDASKYEGGIEAWVKNEANYKLIMGLITLTDPTGEDDPCSFDKVEFRYTLPVDPVDPNPANRLRPFEFYRLIRFIRLWKKLGWTIEQTDKAITALYPADQKLDNADDQVNLQNLDTGFLTLLPRLGVLKRVMKALKLKPKKDLLPLLACFALIDTHGTASLYRQMFLYPAPRDETSPFADDGYGNYLPNGVTLADATERLRAAFLLTDEELNEITAALGYDAGTLLNVDTISVIFRRGWLARKLKLSVREFRLLTQFASIDPFAPPDPPDPPGRPEGPPILRVIELVSRLRTASLKPEQALYLIWNQDISGKSAPDQSEILEFVRMLRTAFAAIESEFALVDDPNGQIALARMGLVYGNDATTFFFGLLDNTLVSEVQYDHGQDSLEQPILDAAPGRIAYDDFGKRLSFTGVMTEAVRDALQAAGASAKFKEAVHSQDPDKKSLFAENQKVVEPFFDRYPELQPLYELYAFFGELSSRVSYSQADKTLPPAILKVGAGRIAYDPGLGRLSFKGVMSAAIHDQLMQVQGITLEFQDAISDLLSANKVAIETFFQDFSQRYPELPIDKAVYSAANDSEAERRTLLLAAFLPELKRRRKRQQALAAVSAAAKADITFASALLDDKFVLNPAAVPASANLDDLPPALDDLTATESAGLSARFYSGTTVGGPGVQPDHVSDAEANLAYSANGGATLPFSPASGVWSGYLEAPENGFYNFNIEPGAAGGAGATTATITLDGLTLKGEDGTLEKNGEVWSNTTAIELRAGTLYPITLEVENITAGLKVRWQTKGRGWELIPPHYLYPATLTGHLRATYVRFLKAVSLAAGLKLTASEMAYFAAHIDYRIGERGWLNSLPVAGSPDGATSTALLKAFEALLDFAGLKAKLAPNDERLLAVLKDPAATIEAADNTTESPLLTLTRWDGGSLDDLLVRFGKVGGQPPAANRTALKDIGTFLRVHRAYGLVKKLGISAAALIQATTNEPEASTVRALQAALRARYDESDWLNVLRPINDDMRALQRDVLVAYILHQMSGKEGSQHIDTPDKLFEYFLMDVQMDPCMLTSRIRHALSSVQLFIERCLMNLEPRVAPPVFTTAHRKLWEWMKRYRVWEANRKVFLWPENWLEPELRDDQSPFFKEAMSELLQSDITEDRAATALLNYLSKLEEVAKLEPCGMYVVEPEFEEENPVVHVVARTAGANRKYYYRRREGRLAVGAGYWTPWEQIKLDIEDNPVIPVVWNYRLFLFWIKILKEAPLTAQIPEPSGEDKKLTSLQVTDIPTDPPKVKVQAMLCWSEYFNGKWQPTKTSDVNRPTTLDQFAPVGQGAFDRSHLSLWAFEEVDTLRIALEGQGTSSFHLYNTHSLPVPESWQDFLFYWIDTFPEFPLRLSHVNDDILVTSYFKAKYKFGAGADITRFVLANPIASAEVGPQHPLRNAWEAPLFYRDSRHVFYVTTEKAYVPIDQGNSYSLPGIGGVLAIPNLVWEEKPLPGPQPEWRMNWTGDPSPIEQFVSEDAYIKIGIATGGTVHFDGTVIGPAGGMTKLHVSAIEGE